MSAGTAEELFTGRDAERSTTGRTVTRAWKVRCTSASDDETVALSASGLPTIGTAHPSWTVAKCSRLRAVPFDRDTLTLWRVTATYQTPRSNETTENPTAQDDVIRIETAPYVVPASKDVATGATIANSAADPYDPPAEKQESRLLITVTRNLSSWTPSTARTYVDTVNSAALTLAGMSCAAQTLRMLKVSAEKLWAADGTRYWQVRYEIEYREGTHKLELLDQGLRKLVTVGAATELQRITDDEGKEVQTPVKLDGSGGVLAYGGTPVYETWSVYEAVSWTGLGLPGSA